ncbi:hypothetical protein Fmac_019303 [Flemingia macrophylla]|uniref:Epidermal patterning factor-like protein n=1 Tax=Flemingia macrophylla TaxID=520843 RepID=A0ABD1M7E3_9FABA
MRTSSVYAAAFLLVLLCVPEIISARRIINGSPSRDGKERWYWEGSVRRKEETVEVAGSRLPDCSHACGSCSPCRLVMVSFVCASLAEAESCPMAYKCMCHNKSYPVP